LKEAIKKTHGHAGVTFNEAKMKKESKKKEQQKFALI